MYSRWRFHSGPIPCHRSGWEIFKPRKIHIGSYWRGNNKVVDITLYFVLQVSTVWVFFHICIISTKKIHSQNKKKCTFECSNILGKIFVKNCVKNHACASAFRGKNFRPILRWYWHDGAKREKVSLRGIRVIRSIAATLKSCLGG